MFKTFAAAAMLLFICSELMAQSIANGRYSIISRHSGLSLEVAAGSTADGANIQQWSYNAGAHQHFDVTYLNNGYYSIRPAHSEMSLDVYAWSLDPGGEIRQWTYLAGDNQQWAINSVGSGFYSITSKWSGLNLDVWEWSASNGGDIRQWSDTGAYNQQWAFNSIDSNPPSGDCNSVSGQTVITVAQNGGGQFTSVQAAINTVPTSNSQAVQIRIAPGTYYEKILIDRPNITLCGQAGQAAATVLTYNDTATTPAPGGGTLGTSGSYSVSITADDISIENMTVENSHGPGVQAVALRISAERMQCRNCIMLGNQDTLYTHGGSQYFRDSYIEGTVDFIFGHATAVFENCHVHSVGGGTAITAPNTEQSQAFGLVFLGGSVTNSGVSNDSVALGRNWGAYGAAAFLRVNLAAHISPAGWVPMGSNTLATARFSEYLNTGPGADTSGRAPESRQLSASEAATYTLANIFGGAWIPSFSQ